MENQSTNKKPILLLVSFLIVLILSCNPSDKFIGLWVSISDPDVTLSISKNQDPNSQWQGKYKFIIQSKDGLNEEAICNYGENDNCFWVGVMYKYYCYNGNYIYRAGWPFFISSFAKGNISSENVYRCQKFKKQ